LLSQVSLEIRNSSDFNNILISNCRPYLYQPPITLKPSENKTDQDRTEIAIVKLLVKSYYDIVRKSIEDAVPKAIMHFLVSLSSTLQWSL
jgi:hypothetical protein